VSFGTGPLGSAVKMLEGLNKTIAHRLIEGGNGFIVCTPDYGASIVALL
jgi:hypothetical protein